MGGGDTEVCMKLTLSSSEAAAKAAADFPPFQFGILEIRSVS